MPAIETFFSAWGEADAAARRKLLDGSVAPDVSYADPRAPDGVTGIAALAEYVAAFSANAPGWAARVVKSDSVQGYLRVTVAFGGAGPDGRQMVQHGQYFAQTSDDGKISMMVGFVGTGAPE